MQYLLTNRDGAIVITLIEDNGTIFETVSHSHVNFQKILAHVQTGIVDDKRLRDLARPVNIISERLSAVSSKFSYADEQLLFDGEPILDMFANQLVRVIKATDTDTDEGHKHLEAVAKFGEKLMGNTSFHVRNNLLKWVSDRDLTITSDGDFLAYKGVACDEDQGFVSVAAGPANLVKVNGKFVPEGRVPNPVGAVITMDRRHINDDHAVGCSQGLHAGTFGYARDFGQGGLLMVAVNPEDVVTVPTDCGYQKLRCAKYRVLDVTEYEYHAPVYDTN